MPATAPNCLSVILGKSVMHHRTEEPTIFAIPRVGMDQSTVVPFPVFPISVLVIFHRFSRPAKFFRRRTEATVKPVGGPVHDTLLACRRISKPNECVKAPLRHRLAGIADQIGCRSTTVDPAIRGNSWWVRPVDACAPS